MVSVKPGWKSSRAEAAQGEFCAIWRSKELVIGFAAEPVREGHPPAWLVVHAPASASLIGRYFNRLESGYGLLRLSDVEVRFSPEHIQHGSPDYVPSGSLILGEEGPSLYVRTDDPREFGISLQNGEIGPADLYRSFWTPRWRLMHAGADETAEPIFEFGQAQAG